MKRIVLMLTVLASLHAGLTASAQMTQKTYYMEVYELTVLQMKSVCVNYGLNAPLGKSYKIMDDNMKLIKFDNVIGALNYLSEYGWEVLTVYQVDLQKAGQQTHYLMKLDLEKHPADSFAREIDKMLAELEKD